MSEIGIKKTHDNLTNKLIDYIKAQYLAENDLLVDAGEDLLAKREFFFRNHT